MTEPDWRAHAEALAAALSLTLHDAHPQYPTTAKWHGGIGGRAITWHCALTQGAQPGAGWAEHDLPSTPLRALLAVHPFDYEALKAQLKTELADPATAGGVPTAGWGWTERLAALLGLVLHDAHRVYGSTAKWHGGIGGQALTWHCALTQGTPPGDEWADRGRLDAQLQHFLAVHPFDLDQAKTRLKADLLTRLHRPTHPEPKEDHS